MQHCKATDVDLTSSTERIAQVNQRTYSSAVGVQSPSFTYDYSNAFVGLESRTDQASFSGNVLTISFTSKDPGDHIRVFTSAVPEPGTHALMAAGLLAIGFASKRRRSSN